MDFLSSIPISSVSGFIGLALLALGGFMVLAGVGIISIQQVTVKQSRATWVLGLALAAIGLVMLLPELSRPGDASGSPVVTQPAVGGVGGQTGWVTPTFNLPDDGLWREPEIGTYTATGYRDTLAWSRESFSGDVEITLDVDSPHAEGEATLVLFGDGRGFAPGVLAFVVSAEFHRIIADTIFEGGNILYEELQPVRFEGEVHAMRVTVIDRQASLYLDGASLASVSLDDTIGSSGRIGLFKFSSRPQVSFSNVRVRELD